MNSIRIILADDHAMFRAGIRALLSDRANTMVVGEAGDGVAALELVRTTPADVLLLDIGLPRLNGLQVLDSVRRVAPDLRCVMLTMHADEEYVLRALRGGAAGYLLKNAQPAELRCALERVRDGEIFLGAPVACRVAEYLCRSGQADDSIARLVQAAAIANGAP